MTPLVTALTVAGCGLAVLIRAQARWDHEQRRRASLIAAQDAVWARDRGKPVVVGVDLPAGYGEPPQPGDRMGYYGYGTTYEPGLQAWTTGQATLQPVTAMDERCAEFARDPDHAERAAAWNDLRDRMFPPSHQHYWVPNGELPGPDGRWWVFLGATRTIWGFTEADGALACAERMNRVEKRGKYGPLRRFQA